MTEPEIKQFNQLAAAAEETEQTKICTKNTWIEIIGGILSAQKNAFREEGLLNGSRFFFLWKFYYNEKPRQ